MEGWGGKQHPQYHTQTGTNPISIFPVLSEFEPLSVTAASYHVPSLSTSHRLLVWGQNPLWQMGSNSAEHSNCVVNLAVVCIWPWLSSSGTIGAKEENSCSFKARRNCLIKQSWLLLFLDHTDHTSRVKSLSALFLCEMSIFWSTVSHFCCSNRSTPTPKVPL